MSRYDADDDYVYPDTEVLRNKADIHDQVALDAYEADATAIRMLELIERPIIGQFDVRHLCAIHHHLFQDVYDWAGEFRTVDISRGASRFANINMIESYLSQKLGELGKENFLKDLSPEVFIVRLAHYMSEINATHPFREGNGRVQRFFCSQLAEQAGYFIDFETVDRDEMYDVMMKSFQGDEQPLAALLGRITAIIE